MNETNVQRNYKDTVFRMLFKEKENLLSLYNALNQTSYTDVGRLEITTLENAIYMNYKNDISFVFDYELLLYEHQSTLNPNMPLRNLMYVAKVLQERINLSKNRAEAIAVSIFEYDMEKHMKSERKEACEELAQILQELMNAGKIEELKRALSDREYREQLYREYIK